MTTPTVDVQNPFTDSATNRESAEAKFFTAPTQKAPLPSNVCPNCLSTNAGSKLDYCEKCGYYARFGTVVGGQEQPIEEREFPMTSITAMAVAFIAVGLFNIATLFYTPQGSPERTWWSLAQLTVGSIGFIFAHMFCFFRTLSVEESVGMMDFIVSPTVGWVNSAKRLPRRLWAFVTAIAGVTAMLGSTLVLGGIPYNGLFEGGPKMERQDLISAIGQAVHKAQQAQQGTETLEEALLGFSDEGAEPPLDFLEEPKRIYKDAVVIAYWTDSIGVVDQVLLAGAIDGKLQQLGMVSQLPQGASKKLSRVLPKYARSTPFLSYASDPSQDDASAGSDSASSNEETPISTGHNSVDNGESDGDSNSQGSGIRWVQPKWLCRISYAETNEGIPIDTRLHWVVRKMIFQ